MTNEITDFVAGLEALSIDGVTMLGSEPASVPSDSALPVAWVALPTIIGLPPTTVMNSAIRPRRYRALILVAVAYDRQDEQKDRYTALMATGQNVEAALDAASFGFRLEYEIAIDRKISAGGSTFFGVAALVTGER